MIGSVPPVMPERPVPWDREAFMTDLRAKLDARRAARQQRFNNPRFPAPGGPGPMPYPAALNNGGTAPPAFNPAPQPAVANQLAQRKMSAPSNTGGGGGVERGSNTRAY